MNNPFSRLKHFTSDEENDSQENHATECLAACLVFSSKIRGAFIHFLFGGEPKIEIGDTSKVEVVTQLFIESGGYIDLVLNEVGKFNVAVEVKVRSPEDCSHHREQLEKYREWLDNENKSNAYLFTLVRNPEGTFCPKKYGADGRHSWRDLYNRFRELKDLSDVETSLIENFCEYLESEGIVSTYETKDLLSYSAGLKARKAVAGLFNQVASRLEAESAGFESVLVDDRKGHWPVLKIQNSGWKKIFGKGKNQKISLWFTVPGIWEAKRHDFRFEIELWHEEHGNDWKLIEANLPTWFKTLKAQKFCWTVWQTWKNPQDNIPPKQIKPEPIRIIAWKTEKETILNEKSPQDEDELLDLLVERAKEYAKIVSSLEV